GAGGWRAAHQDGVRLRTERRQSKSQDGGEKDAANGQGGGSCCAAPLSAINRRNANTLDYRMSRHPPGRRSDYCWFYDITMRWMDNDVFRHVNNVNYFSFFDTAVTYYEMSNGVVDLLDGPVHCVVAEVMCRYHSSVAFPDRIAVNIR